MPQRHLVLSCVIALVGLGAQAQETKTTYSISSSMAYVTTLVKNASSDQEKLMRSFPFAALAEKLRLLPMVTGVEFNRETKAEITTNDWADYFEHKRSFPAIVHLNLPAQVTLMLRVEETHRTCKSPAERGKASSSAGRYDEGSMSSTSVDCSLSTTARIRGPYAVYGNFASATNIEKLLKERQSIAFDVSRDYSDKSTMRIDSKFVVESELFEVNLFKFLKVFNLSLSSGQPSFSESFGLDMGSQNITRNQLLLGISRLLRLQNERLVE